MSDARRITAILLGAGWLLAAKTPPQEATWHVTLDAAAPYRAAFRLDLPETNEPVTLAAARDGDGATISTPRCGDAPLQRAGEKGWRVPAGCRAVSWSASLIDHDADGIDASVPVSAWSADGRFWFLAERSGFLRPAGQDPGGRVEIAAAMPGAAAIRRSHAYPAYNQPPYYAAVGDRPTARYEHEGATLDIHGTPPARDWMPDLQLHILAIWAGWRRDVLPARMAAPTRLAFVWLDTPKGAEPGMTASAGADAIALQLKPREGDPEADRKMRAAMMLLGAHEGFHTLIGAYGQTWPAWVNESLANHFAYRAVVPHLDTGQHAFIDQQVMAEAPISLADAQAAYAGGDDQQGDVFYGKGARFWMAIEKVLTTPDGQSGRLGALVKSSNSFADLDWSNLEAIAAYFNTKSNDRAGPIVRCFLAETGCAWPPS